MTSFFRWEGRVEEEVEVALIAKCPVDGFARLEERVAELHSYDCPCIVAWPIAAGHVPYLEWVRSECGG